MPLVATNDVTLHVQHLGTPQAQRPPVVMLHGLLLGSLASWYFTAAPALARTHAVMLYDLRGHGLSERATCGYDLATMTRDLATLTADRGPMILVGHSYGALIALRFAIAYPERVARLALVDAPLPPSRMQGNGEIGAFLDRTPAEMITALPDSVRSLVERGSRQARRLLGTLQFLVYQSSLLADLDAEPDLSDTDLAAITCPVACYYGDSSSCLPAGRRLARVVPNASLHILPGGHYLHLDAAAALTTNLVEFIHG